MMCQVETEKLTAQVAGQVGGVFHLDVYYQRVGGGWSRVRLRGTMFHHTGYIVIYVVVESSWERVLTHHVLSQNSHVSRRGYRLLGLMV